MEKNRKIILAIAVIVIVIIIAGIAASGILNSSDEETTPFNNTFMEGNFVGNVSLANNSTPWMLSYSDSAHSIEYNISSCRNGSFLMDYFLAQGVSGPEEREYGGQEWDIYRAQAVPNVGNNTTNATQSNEVLNIYICHAVKDNQSYLIYMIVANDTDLESDGSMFCEAYTDYLEPLLSNVNLIHNDDVPEVYTLLGLDEASFNQLQESVNQYLSGNMTQ